MRLNMNWKHILQNARKYLINKYVITLLAAAFLFTFVGSQSLIKRTRRARQIHKAEQQLEASRQDIQQAKHTMQMLQNPDSLERYAREHYYMHTPKEDVYVVDN